MNLYSIVGRNTDARRQHTKADTQVYGFDLSTERSMHRSIDVAIASSQEIWIWIIGRENMRRATHCAIAKI
jgi:hypothetical protein